LGKRTATTETARALPYEERFAREMRMGGSDLANPIPGCDEPKIDGLSNAEGEPIKSD
jgi:hypothetical protein